MLLSTRYLFALLCKWTSGLLRLTQTRLFKSSMVGKSSTFFRPFEAGYCRLGRKWQCHVSTNMVQAHQILTNSKNMHQNIINHHCWLLNGSSHCFLNHCWVVQPNRQDFLTANKLYSSTAYDSSRRFSVLSSTQSRNPCTTNTLQWHRNVWLPVV